MINKIKKHIETSSADFTEICHLENRGSSVYISNGEIETCVNFDNSASSVRTFKNQNIGFCGFNDQDFALGLKSALENTNINSFSKRNLAHTKSIQASIENFVKIPTDSMCLEDKFNLTKKISDTLQSAHLTAGSVEFKNYTKDIFYTSSNGTAITQKKHFTGIRISASLKTSRTLQQSYFSEGSFGGLEILDSVENQVEILVKRVKDLCQAPKIEPGRYRVLLNQNLAGVFAHEAFGHMSEADFLADNPELHQKIALGSTLGVEDLNITDDGSDSSLCGWCPYDDEGVPSQKRQLIKNGKVHSYLHSRITAYDMKMPPSGNGRALNPFFNPIPRMTNTYIENGSRSFESLLEELWDGIYACDMLGGMTNLETFTFSAAYGYRVKNGKIVELLRDIVLSGNLFETMKNIRGIGNDLLHHGGLGGCGKAGQNGLPVSTGSPHILIDNVLIG